MVISGLSAIFTVDPRVGVGKVWQRTLLSGSLSLLGGPPRAQAVSIR